jgi:hypothetical protein
MTVAVVYQPCSDPVARKNLQNTILNPIFLDDIEHLLDPALAATLRAESPSGKLYIWGLSPSNTESAWLRMAPNDVVMFNVKGVVTVTSRFTHRTRNRDLALHLWGLKDVNEGSTWENVYFVSDVRHVSIPYPHILLCTESQPRMSFNRFSESDSAAIINRYEELLCEVDDVPVSLEEARFEINLEMETDGSAPRPTRNEHRFIVKHLFKGLATGTCCICLNDYPRNMLVAAHIKKRASCDRNEKLDIENIAAPMCRMGCDPLFEFGYISVRDGVVVRHPSLEAPAAISSYIDGVLGNLVPAWGQKTKKYFQWHRDTHGFEPAETMELLET